jgi:hypothetical protein
MANTAESGRAARNESGYEGVWNERYGRGAGKERKKGVVHVKEGHGSYLISSFLVLVMQSVFAAA